MRGVRGGCRDVIFKDCVAETRSHQEGAIEHRWVCTVDGNGVTNQETVIIRASNGCSLVVKTTRYNLTDADQFFNVIQPRSNSLVIRCRSKRRNIQFVARQIVRSSVRKNRGLSICNTQDTEFAFVGLATIDINEHICKHNRACIPVFNNTVLRTSTFDELVQSFLFILNNFLIIDADCAVSFRPTDCGVHRNDGLSSVKCLNQCRFIRNGEGTLQSFLGNCEFIHGAYTSIDRNNVFNQRRCRTDIGINLISVLEELGIAKIERITAKKFCSKDCINIPSCGRRFDNFIFGVRNVNILTIQDLKQILC